MSCPFASANYDASSTSPVACPFHNHREGNPEYAMSPDLDVHLKVRGGTHQATAQSAELLHDIGGPDRIRIMCTRFYAHAFNDVNTMQFFFLEDGAEMHGQRLGDWIIEKMDKNNPAWSNTGRYGQRQPSHHAAWNSSRRSPAVRGRHFGLKDTRIWMRLMFYAGIECGLDRHKPFWSWWKEFLGHFIAVYERYAPRYVEDSVAWAQSGSENFKLYARNGFVMLDDTDLDTGPRMVDLVAQRVRKGTL